MKTQKIAIREYVVGESTAQHWDFSDSVEVLLSFRSSIRVMAADGFQVFTLREGEGAFIPPRTISSVAAADKNAVVRSLSFPLSALLGDEDSIIYRKYSEPILSLSGPVSLSQMEAGKADRAFEIISERAYCSELEARNLLTEMLIAVLLENENAVVRAGVYRNQRMLGMMTFIKEHYTEPITLGDIAASGHVSERECLRVFRSSLGTSPVQFLISYRLRESLRLLENTEMQIAQIAYRTGFESPSHFSRSFRSCYGFSPSQWRRRFL